MSLVDKSCREFVTALSDKVSVPGGGGAAALGGAIGIALSTMVGNFTVGKKKYAEVEDEVKELIEKGLKVQEELLALIAKDAEAFEPLSQAYGLPNGTDEEKKVKAEVLERESKNAVAVPMEIMRKSYEGIKIHERMGQIGSRMLISDVGCGVVFLRGSLIAGKLNVMINLNTIEDQEFIKATKAEVDHLTDDGIKVADEVYQSVLNEITK
ncbi:cyclodeaminase/cyclohydrolase family protein [Dehalobacterium formicoaceticum]|uniref:Cyclodeaminase/cyclohydrolase family protein n=1 Tax=Dehalobacterium formicoaceticum TaxID=51515 RepID=A0ABT1Y5D5_9FIRM|nr:cyclodeaminase/cyclohydrolase family protein [Dehalobacterium formicoaceticum]MCR6546088.1 cyclodeaminase/cyclohydrolase family protein [Dehalobacterium formicoaceticum]